MKPKFLTWDKPKPISKPSALFNSEADAIAWRKRRAETTQLIQEKKVKRSK